MESVDGQALCLLVALLFRPTVQQNTTACDPNPCGHGGTCYPVGDSFNCTCTEDFTGSECTCYQNASCGVDKQQGICNPFLNSSQSIGGQNALCLCDVGFTGDQCHIEVDECTHPISIGGIQSEPGKDVCKGLDMSPPCDDRRNGFACDYCAINVCKNNATCVLEETERSFNCACPLHFGGRQCEQVLCSRSQNCTSQGECSSEYNYKTPDPSKLCDCDLHYGGDSCEKKLCSREMNCSNNGECNPSYDYSNPTAEPLCICNANYTGTQCETEITVMATATVQQACDPNPCGHGGTCYPVGDTFNCTCTEDFTGSECTCYQNASCGVDKQQGICNPFLNPSQPIGGQNLLCLCDVGFNGEQCHIDVNECIHPIAIGGIPSEPGKDVCKGLDMSPPCDDRRNGFACDYCAINVCKNNATCVLEETERSFNCVCPLHFAGRQCEQVLCSRSQNCTIQISPTKPSPMPTQWSSVSTTTQLSSSTTPPMGPSNSTVLSNSTHTPLTLTQPSSNITTTMTSIRPTKLFSTTTEPPTTSTQPSTTTSMSEPPTASSEPSTTHTEPSTTTGTSNGQSCIQEISNGDDVIILSTAAVGTIVFVTVIMMIVVLIIKRNTKRKYNASRRGLS